MFQVMAKLRTKILKSTARKGSTRDVLEQELNSIPMESAENRKTAPTSVMVVMGQIDMVRSNRVSVSAVAQIVHLLRIFATKVVLKAFQQLCSQRQVTSELR